MRALGLGLRAGEQVVPFGDGWLIRDKGGFTPCPWAFELAEFAAPAPGERVLDLGCGGGVLLCALAQVEPGVRAVGVELGPAVDQARRNLLLNAVPAVAVRGDVRALPVAPRAFDLVVSNPPFYPVTWGRESADAQVHAATHAVHGDVADFARAARDSLAPHGRAVFVYDSGQLPALLLALQAAGLRPRAARFLDDDRGRPARVLIAAHRGAGMAVDRASFAGPKEWV